MPVKTKGLITYIGEIIRVRTGSALVKGERDKYLIMTIVEATLPSGRVVKLQQEIYGYDEETKLAPTFKANQAKVNARKYHDFCVQQVSESKLYYQYKLAAILMRETE